MKTYIFPFNTSMIPKELKKRLYDEMYKTVCYKSSMMFQMPEIWPTSGQMLRILNMHEKKNADQSEEKCD